MNDKENLSLIVRNGSSIDAVYDNSERLAQDEKDFHFGMGCNGYFLRDGQWKFDPNVTIPFTEEFKGQEVSFFGPSSESKFFKTSKLGYERFFPVFKQPEVLKSIRKYREIDEEQAARIAYIYGGIIRHYGNKINPEKIAYRVRRIAKMTNLGEEKSGDAIASAMAMYVLSSGSIVEDNIFTGGVYNMAEAIRQDPVSLSNTEDLGISQVSRLHNFLSGSRFDPELTSDIDKLKEDFADFPTVGAEFHFKPSILEERPTFLQRLAILNMSQYQRGSYIQLSRNDRGIIEVRMNPSLYPITISDWEHMRRVLPELNQAYFTITLNRKDKDFSWSDDNDAEFLKSINALGLLIYSGLFDYVQPEKDEIEFGTIYLGQTVRFGDGDFKFTGNWGGKTGDKGQIGLYVGFGNKLPHLASYLSMAMAEPNIFRQFHRRISGISSLNDALNLSSNDRQNIFMSILYYVASSERLRKAAESGKQIIEKLSPY